MERFIWPFAIESMVLWLKSHRLSLDFKPYPGRHYDGRASVYAKMITQACKLHDIDCEIVGEGTPARMIFEKYETVLWDSIGTGFWESLAIGCHNFLTPAARAFPTLDEGCPTVSERFFIDHSEHQTPKPLATLFQDACKESSSFLNDYGKIAPQSLSEYIEKQVKNS